MLIPRTFEDLLGEKRTALIVYDMQVGILSQISDGPRVTSAVCRLLEAARTHVLPIFFTRHVSLPKNLMGVFQRRQAMAWQRTDDPEAIKPWFLPDCEATQLAPEMGVRSDEAVVDKITMSAFQGTYLEFALRDLGINSFLIAGVALEIGIEPTVRHATDLGFIPVVVEDACGAGHEPAGRRALESIAFIGDAFITDLKTVCATLG